MNKSILAFLYKEFSLFIVYCSIFTIQAFFQHVFISIQSENIFNFAYLAQDAPLNTEVCTATGAEN